MATLITIRRLAVLLSAMMLALRPKTGRGLLGVILLVVAILVLLNLGRINSGIQERERHELTIDDRGNIRVQECWDVAGVKYCK